MIKSQKNKLINSNAALWAIAILASFILPLITDSVTEGRGKFVNAMVQVGPLLIALLVSTALLSKAIGETAE